MHYTRQVSLSRKALERKENGTVFGIAHVRALRRAALVPSSLARRSRLQGAIVIEVALPL